MLKRILFFSNPFYLSVKNSQLIITSKESGEIKKAVLEDLGFVILDNEQITFTQSFIQELAENNVAVVFCNKKHHPSSMLFHLDSNHVQTEVFRHQINAGEPLKKLIWKQIIIAKIKNQAKLFEKTGKDNRYLLNLLPAIKSGDSSNREAVAAKYYWANIFGKISNANATECLQIQALITDTPYCELP